MSRLLLAGVFLVLTLSSARADPVHAISMHGAPKYSEEFRHFDYVNPDAPKGGDLKMAKGGSFDNLNPVVITGTAAEGLEYLNDPLMRRSWDEPFTMYGLIAEKIDVTPDRSSVTFYLNPKARFHDGSPITALDVKFSYEAFRKYGHPVRRRVYGLIKDVTIVNDYKITFTFGEGYDRESVMILALMQVLPRHYWGGKDIGKTTLDVPLGSGPYKIQTVDAGRKITYERVRDYWAQDLPVNKGQYNFDTLSYTYFRDDAVSLEAFKAGEYNLRREYDIKKWKTGYESAALNNGKIVKEEIAHKRPEWLKAFIFNTRRPIFSDLKVRQALSYMFNDVWMNKTFYFGAFKRIDSVFPNSELRAGGKPIIPADERVSKKKAVDLLKKAGWIYNNRGQLLDKSGKPFSFEILLTEASDQKMALAFASALKGIGIAVQVRLVDSAQFTGRLESFDYDMVSFRWINSLSPGNEQLNYWGSIAADTKGSRNYAGIKDKDIDKLAASIAQTADRQSLVEKAKELDRELVAGFYMVPLFYLGKDMVAHTSDLKHPEKPPIYGTVLESWWREAQK